MTYPAFNSGDILTAADMNAVGLWKIADTTFTASAKPFINGCFSSNFENYRIVIVTSASASANVFFQMRSGTSTEETGAVYDRYGFQFGTSIESLVNPNNTGAFLVDTVSTTSFASTTIIDIFGPNTTRHTVAHCQSWDSNTGQVRMPFYRIETTTQYTGIQLITGSSPTLTGTMRVYGYRN